MIPDSEMHKEVTKIRPDLSHCKTAPRHNKDFFWKKASELLNL